VNFKRWFRRTWKVEIWRRESVGCFEWMERKDRVLLEFDSLEKLGWRRRWHETVRKQSRQRNFKYNKMLTILTPNKHFIPFFFLSTLPLFPCLQPTDSPSNISFKSNKDFAIKRHDIFPIHYSCSLNFLLFHFAFFIVQECDFIKRRVSVTLISFLRRLSPTQVSSLKTDLKQTKIC
jgi:hypothetical protein